MSYGTETPTLPHPPLGELAIVSGGAPGPTPARPRLDWLRIGAWTTGLVLSAATWAAIATAIAALV